MSFSHDPTEINALAILGADPDIRELASLERLRLAAKVAQAERNMSEKTRARRWKKDSGAVITHVDLIGELNKAQNIEFDVAPLPVRAQARAMARQGMTFREIVEALGLQGIDAPARQKLRDMIRGIRGERPCMGCGAPTPTMHRTRQESRCVECLRPLCPCGCGERAPKGAMTAHRVARRGGAPWVCKSEANRRRHAAMTPEQKERQRKNLEKMRARITREQRVLAARRAHAVKTQEQRNEVGQKARATRVRRAAQ